MVRMIKDHGSPNISVTYLYFKFYHIHSKFLTTSQFYVRVSFTFVFDLIRDFGNIIGEETIYR